MINKSILTAIALLIFTITNLSAHTKRPFYIGVQPAITVEPFYDEGELDFNAFPLIVETPISQRINLRIVPMVNYHVGGLENGISDLGVFTVLPIFLKRTEIENERPSGFYLGPVIGFSRNLINDHFTTTTALEPGYMWKTEKSFTITLGTQLGGSFFGYDSKPNKWVFHWGPKVTFGFWI